MRRRSGDVDINRNVGHKIKKPNLKLIEKNKQKARLLAQKKKLKNKSDSANSLYSPINRSPVKRSKNLSERHVLSPLGVSLLTNGDSENDALEMEVRKFFTSRSRASATIVIGSNVKLSTKNGALTLQQKQSSHIKKNVGNTSASQETEEFSHALNAFVSLKKLPDLPSVQDSPQAMPTRMASPGKNPTMINGQSNRVPLPSTPQKIAVSNGSMNCNIEPSSLDKLQLNTSMIYLSGESMFEMSPQLRRSPRKHFPVFDMTRHIDTQETMLPSVARQVASRSGRGKVRDDTSQMMLDVGQKAFGAQQCPVCSIVYEIGSVEDEKHHHKFHQNFLDTIKFTGWKYENIVYQNKNSSDRILKIVSSDNVHCHRKVKEVRELVDRELGFTTENIDTPPEVAYLYVAKQSVIGCLIAQIIDFAYRVVVEKDEQKKIVSPLCCSETAEIVHAGISRVWVSTKHRRTGVASALVDAMRGSIYPGAFLNVDDIAFSDPTEAGTHFASMYCKRTDFLVYR